LILDTEALRKVDQNGIISRVAGNGETCPFVAGCPHLYPHRSPIADRQGNWTWLRPAGRVLRKRQVLQDLR